MAITYPRALPSSVKITDTRIGLNFNTGMNESSIGRQVTAIANNAGTTDRWEGVYTLAPMRGQAMAEFEAWLISMKGFQKTFYAYDADRRTPNGTAETGTSTPLTVGAFGVGVTSITTDGWAVGATGLLAVGDYFQLGSGFHMVMEVVTSDGSGAATIEFQPAIRSAIANNTPLVFENPVMVARTLTNAHMKDSNKNKVADMAFAFQEVIA